MGETKTGFEREGLFVCGGRVEGGSDDLSDDCQEGRGQVRGGVLNSVCVGQKMLSTTGMSVVHFC